MQEMNICARDPLNLSKSLDEVTLEVYPPSVNEEKDNRDFIVNDHSTYGRRITHVAFDRFGAILLYGVGLDVRSNESVKMVIRRESGARPAS